MKAFHPDIIFVAIRSWSQIGHIPQSCYCPMPMDSLIRILGDLPTEHDSFTSHMAVSFFLGMGLKVESVEDDEE